jgi:hypothetical protein
MVKEVSCDYDEVWFEFYGFVHELCEGSVKVFAPGFQTVL